MTQKTSIYIRIDERLGVERSLKKFKRLCESFGVVREYRKRQEYKKPSIKKVEKTAAAVKRRNKTSFRSGRGGKI
ncbi:MAG: 30S ribosomal protein S21 [Bacteriovoracaceae bacterium]|nr:30S ribosomal protein S21 [Bacteriovoracaceae bacterium]